MHRPIKILLFILLTSGSLLNAQPTFFPGYIVTNRQDTLRGFIMDRGDISNSKICVFRENNSSPVKRFSADDLDGYGMDGISRFKAIHLFSHHEYRPVFAEILMDGKIRLIHQWYNKEMAYYIQKENGPLVPLLNTEAKLPLNITGEKMQLSYTSFIQTYKDTLSRFFNSCNSVLPLIENTGYNARSLIRISKACLNESGDPEKGVIFEKDLRSIRPFFGLVAGIQWISLSSFITDGINIPIQEVRLLSFPAGVFVNFPLRHFTPGLSLQVELNTASMGGNYLSFTNESAWKDIYFFARTFTVPVMLQYRFLPGKLTPIVNAGKEVSFVIESTVQDNLYLHATRKGGWFAGAGVAYALSKNISAFSDLRLSSMSDLVISSLNDNRRTFRSLLKEDKYTYFSTSVLSLRLGIAFR